MIEIKAPFSGWHEVTKEQAKNFVEFKLKNMPAIKPENAEEHINKNRLRGITVKELLNMESKKEDQLDS